MEIINVANAFNRFPLGRFYEDGIYSGQRFRDQCLEPVLRKRGTAIIEMDGTRGYGSSFLEEAFAGLVRKGYDGNELLQAFKFKSEDKSLIDEIHLYIRAAIAVS